MEQHRPYNNSYNIKNGVKLMLKLYYSYYFKN